MLTPEDHDALVAAAAREGLKPSTYARVLIKRALRQDQAAGGGAR